MTEVDPIHFADGPRECRVMTLNQAETHLRQTGWETRTIQLLLGGDPIPRDFCVGELLIVLKR